MITSNGESEYLRRLLERKTLPLCFLHAMGDAFDEALLMLLLVNTQMIVVRHVGVIGRSSLDFPSHAYSYGMIEDLWPFPVNAT